MRAAGPAAGAAHTSAQFGEAFLDADTARLRFFARGDPADPLAPRQRCHILPNGKRLLVCEECGTHIHRELVYSAALYRYGCHSSILPNTDLLEYVTMVL